MTKPILIGLHNPYSDIPKRALVPYPPTSTGGRILDMIQLVDPSIDERDYMSAFDRFNLWRGPQLPTGRGSTRLLMREGRRLFARCTADARHVALFGAKVWACVLNRTPPAWFESQTIDCSTFYYLPHPSGLNRKYNDTQNRLRTGRILLDMLSATQRRERHGNFAVL